MNDIPATTQDPNRSITLVAYGLFLSAFLLGFTSIVAVIIAYVKRKEVAGTVYESHMNFIITLFWRSLIIAVIGIVLTVIFIGIIVLIVLAVWTIYMLVTRGLKAMEAKPIENTKLWV